MLAIDDYRLLRLLVGSGLFGLEVDMSKETGGQAFPRQQWEYEGMTLRDHFATEALGLCFAQYLNFAEIEGFAEGWRDGVAMDAYKMADAMIAARSR